MLTMCCPPTPDTGRWSTIGRFSCAASRASMQDSEAPVSTSARIPVTDGTGGAFAVFGSKFGSKPMLTKRVGPKPTSSSHPGAPPGTSLNPQRVLTTLYMIHERCRDAYWRGPDLPDEIWTAPEFSYSFCGCYFKGIEDTNQLRVADHDPFPHVVTPEIVLHGFVSSNFDVYFSHTSS